MANFEKQYSLRKIKQPTDKYLDDVKEVLVDKGIISYDTPYKLMPEAIISGFKPLREKEIALENTKQALIEKKFANENVDYNDLDDIIIGINNDEETVRYVRNALAEKGLVEENAEHSEISIQLDKNLNNLIPNNIRGNVKIGNVIGEIVTKPNELNLENYIKSPSVNTGYTNNKYFFASNKVDCYYCFHSSSYGEAGIYHFNRITGETTKIYDSGYAWSYIFEASDGKIYVNGINSNDSVNGLFLIKDKTITKIYDYGNSRDTFFEDSKNNIYLVSSFGSTGTMLHIKDEVVTSIEEYGWENFFEDSKGNVYCTSDSSKQYGIIMLKGTVVSTIYRSGYSWSSFFEDSKGNVYLSGNNSTTGILHLNGEIVTLIYGIENGSNYWFYYESNKGYVYVSSNVSASSGILLLEGINVTKIYDEGYYYNNYYEDSKGNLYVRSYNSGVLGLYYFKDYKTLEKIYSEGYLWTKNFEDSKGNLYFASTGSSSKGLLLVNGSTAQKIYANGYNWKTFYEKNDGTIYINGNNNNANILILENNTPTTLYITSTSIGVFTEEPNGGIFATSSSNITSSSTIYYIKDKKIYTLSLKG